MAAQVDHSADGGARLGVLGARTAIDLLALVAAALIVHGPLLEPGAFPSSKQSDLVSYAWPTKQLLYDALHDGASLPLWRNDQLSGNPALTQPQALFTYPLHALYWILPPLRAAGPTFWLELLLAGVGAYALGGALGASRPARLLMGVAHLSSFKLLLLVYAGWVPVLPAMSLLPWFLAALAWFIVHPFAGSFGALALAAGLAFNAGTLQPYFYATLLLGPAVLGHGLLRMRGGRLPAVAATWACVVAAGALGFGLGAHLWIPVLADLPLLSRGSLDYDVFLATKALEPAQLWTLLDPEALGTPRLDSYARTELWEDALYFGWVPTALAIVGFAWGRPRGLCLYLGGGLVATVVLGFDTPLLRALHAHLPGFSLFRVPSRMLFVGAVLVVGLAGLGADAVFLSLRRRGPTLPVALAVACVGVIVVEGTIRSRQYVDMRPISEIEIELPVGSALEASDEPYRTLSFFPLAYGWLRPLGIQTVGGYEPYGYAHYRRYLGKLATGRAMRAWAGSRVEVQQVTRFDLLDALNVRYLMAMGPQALPEGWRPVEIFRRHPAHHYHEGLFRAPLHLYERLQPTRRVFLPDRIVTARGGAEALAALDGIDLRTTAVVESAQPVASAPGPGDTIERIEATPGHVRFASLTAAARFAVVSEVWHPGWRATVDGEAAPLFRANHALLGLELPPGRHEIQLSFIPPGWKLGIAVSLASLLVLAAVAIAALRDLRRNRATPTVAARS